MREKLDKNGVEAMGKKGSGHHLSEMNFLNHDNPSFSLNVLFY